ncbi:hypothetical protein Y032_0482g2285 [Ancylostoma ceylanicum]|uniref:Mos1 transposase HTH domain-containing protein n=1 Tax=Ancylostoma ceylanicum TaxID=53326 RepID=A0A016WVP2_9BILA|nr:hypothetical protein Y032_0482g2285 [Ancylostoma ceylanicum]
MVDMEQLKEAIEEDPSQATRDLANMFSCSHPTVMRRLHAIGKPSSSGQWIHHELVSPHVPHVEVTIGKENKEWGRNLGVSFRCCVSKELSFELSTRMASVDA